VDGSHLPPLATTCRRLPAAVGAPTLAGESPGLTRLLYLAAAYLVDPIGGSDLPMVTMEYGGNRMGYEIGSGGLE
jgi:hypothetical protein